MSSTLERMVALPVFGRLHRGLSPNFLALCGLVLLNACSDSGSGEEDNPAGETSTSAIQITDANNYTSVSTLSIPVVETASGLDLDIDWEGFISDLQCHEVDPLNDVDNVVLLRFSGRTPEDISDELANNTLETSEVDAYLYHNIDDGTSTVSLSELAYFGTPSNVAEDYVDNGDYIYVLLLAEGTVPGIGTRSMTFLSPSTSSSNTAVSVGSACGVLEFDADLASAEPLQVPTTGPWELNWSKLTRDSAGVDVPLQDVDRLLLGYFEGMSVANLEEQIFDIESTATSIWELELAGEESADLADAIDRETGNAFDGFADRGEGVWLLGLMCSNCKSPAPLLLSVLQPG